MVTFCFAVFIYLFFNFQSYPCFVLFVLLLLLFLTTGLIANSLFPSKTSLVKLVTNSLFYIFLLIYLINLSYVSFFCHSCLSSAPSGNVQYRREEVTIWLAVLSM